MDHQLLTESYGNHAQRWDLLVDMTEVFEKTKMEKERRSYYKVDYVQYKEERRFGRCSDQRRQQVSQHLKRAPQKSSLGMQASFLAGSHPHSHSTKGSVGTGVFLPPTTGCVKEPTKKSGCSTILLPAGVVQALKLHFDRVDRQSLSKSNAKPCSCCHRTPLQQDVMNNNSNGYDNAKQRRRFQTAAALWSQDSISDELWSHQDSIRNEEGLPQEWNY